VLLKHHNCNTDIDTKLYCSEFQTEWTHNMTLHSMEFTAAAVWKMLLFLGMQLSALSSLLLRAFSLPALLVFHAQIWNFHSPSQSGCRYNKDNKLCYWMVQWHVASLTLTWSTASNQEKVLTYSVLTSAQSLLPNRMGNEYHKLSRYCQALTS